MIAAIIFIGPNLSCWVDPLKLENSAQLSEILFPTAYFDFEDFVVNFSFALPGSFLSFLFYLLWKIQTQIVWPKAFYEKQSLLSVLQLMQNVGLLFTLFEWQHLKPIKVNVTFWCCTKIQHLNRFDTKFSYFRFLASRSNLGPRPRLIRSPPRPETAKWSSGISGHSRSRFRDSKFRVNNLFPRWIDFMNRKRLFQY